MVSARRREGDRVYMDGPTIRAFIVLDGKELEYSASVARWTSTDELAFNEQGEATAKITMPVDGKRRTVGGRITKIGNRYQFTPLRKD